MAIDTHVGRRAIDGDVQIAKGPFEPIRVPHFCEKRSPSMTIFVDALVRDWMRTREMAPPFAHETPAFAIYARVRRLVISRRGIPPIRTHIANGGAENHDGRNSRRDR
jgi:hypothetical protein